MILVTGATGYIGARLVSELLTQGRRVRAVSRFPEKLASRPWARHPNVERAVSDVHDQMQLAKVLEGVGVVYYLVHSMEPGTQNFAQKDREAARVMAEGAEHSGVKRIIYLGGLGKPGASLSKHLASRAEVADILRSGPVPVTVFRAAMVIGSGSASFEILRYLVERLPVMITPRWLQTPNQPIAIRDVIYYLSQALDSKKTIGKDFDIGGSSVLTYKMLMDIYAEEASLPKRFVVPVPVLTPRLSSYWIHLVTPLSAAIARPLAEGLRNPVICRDSSIKPILPHEPLPPRLAIRAALQGSFGSLETLKTRMGAREIPVEFVYPGDPGWAGGSVFEDKREILVNGKRTRLWNVISGLGGKNGWYHADWLWKFRGWIDRLAGGPGLRPEAVRDEPLRKGSVLDCWRVLRIEEGSELAMAAEMKLPGRAVLIFNIEATAEGFLKLTQCARFVPRGLAGILYWFLIGPFHHFVFSGMISAIAKRAGKETRY